MNKAMVKIYINLVRNGLRELENIRPNTLRDEVASYFKTEEETGITD